MFYYYTSKYFIYISVLKLKSNIALDKIISAFQNECVSINSSHVPPVEGAKFFASLSSQHEDHEYF